MAYLEQPNVLNVKMTAKKMGRPTENPKPHRIMTRLDEVTFAKLKKFCEKKSIGMAEGIR